MFWGEWEPEGRVVKTIIKPLPGHPEFIVVPLYSSPAEYRGLQNTDPFVFGDRFLYTGCQQWTHSRFNRLVPTQLRFLRRGSMILFGSQYKKQFHIDTVFIVSHWVDHHRATYETALRGAVPDVYFPVTLLPWYRSGAEVTDEQSFRLYFGATYAEPVEGMFSFFPCLPYSPESMGFERPVIKLDGVVTDTLSQGKRITLCHDIAVVKAYWARVIDQVILHGLALGLHAEIPKEHSNKYV